MKPVVAIVEWFGPYSLQEAQSATFDYEDGIYIALGKTVGQRVSCIQYVGLASDLKTRLNGCHHKLPLITRELQLWLGEVVSPRTPGRKIKVTDRMLDLTEWAHAYFLQLPLNDKKKSGPPDRPITVYNRWWRKDYVTPYRRRPHRDWPDVIDFMGTEYHAKIVWFGGRQLIQNALEFTQ